MGFDDVMALAGSIVALGRLADRILDAFTDAWRARKLEPSVRALRAKRGYTVDLARQQHSLDVLSEDLRAIEVSVRTVERWVESQKPAVIPSYPPELEGVVASPVDGAQDIE